MKAESLSKIMHWLITWIWVIIPGAIGATIYWFTKDLFFPILLFFLLINKSLFDVYQSIEELKEQKAEEDKQWKNILSKRKSF